MRLRWKAPVSSPIRQAKIMRMELQICDRTYSLLPTAQAVCRVENELGAGIIRIIRKLAAGDVFVDEMALIVFHFIYANHQDATPSLEQIKDAIVENGLIYVLEPLSEAFSYLMEAEKTVHKKMPENITV